MCREPQDALNRRGECALSEFDVKHRFVAAADQQIPYGRGWRWGSSSNTAVNILLGSSESPPILTAQAGLGLTVTQAFLIDLGGDPRCHRNESR